MYVPLDQFGGVGGEVHHDALIGDPPEGIIIIALPPNSLGGKSGRSKRAADRLP